MYVHAFLFFGHVSKISEREIKSYKSTYSTWPRSLILNFYSVIVYDVCIHRMPDLVVFSTSSFLETITSFNVWHSNTCTHTLFSVVHGINVPYINYVRFKKKKTIIIFKKNQSRNYCTEVQSVGDRCFGCPQFCLDKGTTQ